jgi:hypothetical protein
MRASDPSRSFLVVALLAALGCGGGSAHPPTGTDDTGTGGGGSGGAGGSGGGVFVEASHTALPQLTYQGGPLVTAPEIVTVTFAGDPYVSTLEAFDDQLVTSSWWSTVTSGYCTEAGACVGPGWSGGHVELSTPAAPSYTDSTNGSGSTLQTFLWDEISQAVFPATDENTIYVVYFPVTTQISVSATGEQTNVSCQQFGGYHESFSTDVGTTVVYAVIPECAPAKGSNLTQTESLTFAASHEIVEAATDPVQATTLQNQQTLGYYLNLSDPTVLGWNLLGGGEAADLCVDITGLNQDATTEDGYTVQRIWSNASAAAGLDPCVPTPPNDVYFNVAPSATNSFVVLSIGESTTFEADAFSTTATSSWTLGGVDWETAQQAVTSPLLTFTFNGQKTATVNNGDKVEVTVTLDADPSQFGGAEGLLLSLAGSPTAPSAAHYWPILVLTPDEAKFGM